MATRDTVVGGQEIREGQKVVMFYNSANRDEAAFEAADAFDIRRNPNPHLGFGVATHFCLGAHLARMEARVFLDELLATCTTIERTGDPLWVRSNLTNGYRALPLRLAR